MTAVQQSKFVGNLLLAVTMHPLHVETGWSVRINNNTLWSIMVISDLNLVAVIYRKVAGLNLERHYVCIMYGDFATQSLN